MYEELLTITDFERKLLPHLSDIEIRCALCNKTFPRLWGAHLRSHADFLLPKQAMKRVRKPQATIEAEQLANPEQIIDPWTERPEKLSETYSRLFGATSLLNALVDKTFRLYSPSREEWTLMEHLPQKAEWTTITSESTGWPWHTNYLTKDRLKEHFQGRYTLGIKPRGKSRTKVIVLDVDSVPQWGKSPSGAEARAKQTTRALVRVMKRHKLDPHVTASGSKGYHISLYFDSLISNTMARNLHTYMVNHPDVPMEGVQVECLPQNRAVKLPLGIHWGTKKFCAFVDPLTLIPLTDPYSYFLKIRPMNRKVLDEFVKEPEAQKSHKRKRRMDDSWSAVATEMAYKLGIEARGTRHHTALRAAAYLINYVKPDTFDHFEDLLVEWSQKQYKEKGANIRTSWFEHLLDVKRIAKYVWENRFSGGIELSVDFTASDVHWICSQTGDLAAQRLLLAALYQQRTVGGHFYFGFARMQQLTGLAKDSLAHALEELRENRGILKIVQKYSHQTGLGKSKTTKYALAEVPEHQGIDSVLKTVTSETWTRDLWFQLLQMVFTPAQIKQLHPFAYHRILAISSAGNHVVKTAN